MSTNSSGRGGGVMANASAKTAYFFTSSLNTGLVSRDNSHLVLLCIIYIYENPEILCSVFVENRYRAVLSNNQLTIFKVLQSHFIKPVIIL